MAAEDLAEDQVTRPDNQSDSAHPTSLNHSSCPSVCPQTVLKCLIINLTICLQK
jgi:hypothetical protein